MSKNGRVSSKLYKIYFCLLILVTNSQIGSFISGCPLESSQRQRLDGILAGQRTRAIWLRSSLTKMVLTQSLPSTEMDWAECELEQTVRCFKVSPEDLEFSNSFDSFYYQA